MIKNQMSCLHDQLKRSDSLLALTTGTSSREFHSHLIAHSMVKG